MGELIVQKTIDVQKYKEMYHEFVTKKETVMLSFIDEKGEPFTSVAPFVEHNGKLYVYLSEVADHYQLMDTNEKVSALIVADEAESKNRFATERARWICRREKLGNEGYEEIFTLFNKSFGEKMVTMLRKLDFSLFELQPEIGRYVVGFGLAFDTNFDGSIFKHVVIDHTEKDKSNKVGVENDR